MPKKIAYRNKSPTGWWLASYIERVAWSGEKPSAKSRSFALENTIILKAKDRDSAYKKAMTLGAVSTSTFSDGKKKGKWVFMGLTGLIPIYEPLKDGAEIFYNEHNQTLAALKRRVKTKRQLAVFDDTPAIGDTNN